MKFKHKEITDSSMKKKLRAFYKLANKLELLHGVNWYVNMRAWIEGVAESYDIPMYKACGIFAALSPQQSVELNKALFKQFLRDGNASHYALLVNKCKDILDAPNEYQVCKILNGNKIRAFYLNILHPDKLTGVTIDRHAVACVTQTPKRVEAIPQLSMTDNQYKGFKQVYIDVANEVGLLPQELQAVTWETYRRLRDLKRYEHVPF